MRVPAGPRAHVLASGLNGERFQADELHVSTPHDDLPRSPSGRVPRWVRDEASGRAVDPAPWRAAAPTPLVSRRRRPRGSTRPGRTRRRPRVRRVRRREAPQGLRLRQSSALSWLLVVLVVAAVLARWIGQHPDGIVGAWNDLTQSVGQGPPASLPLSPEDRVGPPPGQGEADAPLGAPPAVADPGAPHEFTQSQTLPDGTTVPVAWSPCRAIHYVVDPTGAPQDFPDRAAAAIADVSAATGFAFIYDGTAVEPASASREPYQPDLYGDRWAPALIRFTDATVIPEFATDYVGLGGPVGVRATSDGVQHFVSGFAYLDLDLLASPDVNGEPAYVPVLRHELGHMIGLAHVDDPTQLMYGDGNDVTTFQSGDLAGLAELGSGSCAPDI